MNLSIIESSRSEYIDSILVMHPEISVHSRIKWMPQEGASQLYPLVGGKQDIVLIVVEENRFLATILEFIHDLAIRDVYAVRLFAIDKRQDFLRGFCMNSEEMGVGYDKKLIDKIPAAGEKPYLVHLETHVCDHCNLNCKACNNFSPYVSEPAYADSAQFDKDIRHLAELFSGIGRFFLLGGEPLLAPELCCEMIGIYRRYFPYNELRVLTNATRILVMDDHFWDCLRDNDVIIHISLYPPVRDSIAAVENRLIDKGISYIIFKRVERFAKKLTEYPFEDPTSNNLRCGSSACHYLRNGMISKCPDAWLSGYMPGELGARYRSKDNLNLYELDAWEIIRKTNAPIDLCRYCACTHMDMIEWETAGSNPDPKDWLARHKYEYENDKLKQESKRILDELELTRGQLISANDAKTEISNELSKVKCRLEKELSSVKQTLREKEKKQERLDSELNRLNTVIAETGRQKELITEEMNALKLDYDSIVSSYSYRVGRYITSLPRAIRRFWRSFVRYGMRNAIRGSFEHNKVNAR